MMDPKIIYEDDDLIVLDKPAGMVVNRAQTTKEMTVQDWVEKYLGVPKAGKVPKVPKGEEAFDTSGTFSSFDTFRSRSGIVHRLDKETSGILLVAKTEEAFEELQRQFKEREVKKKYKALVTGKVEPEVGEINAPVGRLPWDREKFGVFPGGREARTAFRTINKLTINNQQYTLLELTPTTGRTHQIRIHLKYLGYPIIGDLAYSGRKQAKKDRQWCERMFLHAAYISFKHPKSGKIMEFESELPEGLKQTLKI